VEFGVTNIRKDGDGDFGEKSQKVGENRDRVGEKVGEKLNLKQQKYWIFEMPPGV
jgi:hypothetical protein